MQLTKKQEEGLKIAIERYRNHQRYTVIAGYAGSGKSTLVRFIIDALNVDENEVVYTSFTGKATQVLQKKGNKNVSTLHKLLYEHFPRPDGTFFRKEIEIIPYKIVVVDECSMVPKELIDVLAKHKNLYIIFLGDPGQLPPVDKNSDNHLLDSPHIFLDEIMRQAAESEIIQLTMKIRNNEPIPYMKGKEVQVITKEELNTGMLLWADQIIVGTNATRVAINNKVRQLRGKGADPEDGDKIICLRNYWDCISTGESALINGAIGTIHNNKKTLNQLPFWLSPERKIFETVKAEFINEEGESFGILNMDNSMIETGIPSLDWKTTFKMGKNPLTRDLIPMEFTYGYAITCWKAQGSEWDNVLVLEESFPFDKEEHKKFLYTALTRAAKKVVLVRK